MIAAGEAHQMGAFGVIAGEPHRLHHRFGAGHVERDFVEPGNFGQAPDVVEHDRVVEAEHRPELMRALRGGRDALLVEILAEDVDAIGAGQVVEHVAVEIGQRDAGGRLHEAAGAEIFANQAAVLERHPVGLGELQVGNPRRRVRRHLAAAGEALLIERRESEEAVLALHGDRGRRAVGAEERVDVELVMRDQPRHQARHLGVSGERAMLGARQRQPGLELGGGDGGHGDRAGGERENRKRCVHDHKR